MNSVEQTEAIEALRRAVLDLSKALDETCKRVNDLGDQVQAMMPTAKSGEQRMVRGDTK